MTDHFVLAFETFAAEAAGAALHGTEVRAVLGVDFGVGAVSVSPGR